MSQQRACSALPFELWKLIIQQLGQRDRVGACSRVSTLLLRAATAATDDLEVSLFSWKYPARILESQQLQMWLMNHGRSLSSLKLRHADRFDQLPCPQLRLLDLSNLSTLLGPSSSSPGILQGLKSLSKLRL